MRVTTESMPTKKARVGYHATREHADAGTEY